MSRQDAGHVESRSGARPDNRPGPGGTSGVQGDRRSSRSDANGALDAARGTEIIADRGETPTATATFGNVLDRALAVKSLEWSPGSRSRFVGVAKNYLARWRQMPLDEITRSRVLAWVGELQDAAVRPGTIVKALAVFRATWAEAQRSGLVDTPDPSGGLSVQKPAHVMGRALSVGELAALVGATRDDEAMRLQLLITGVLGLRWGEMAGLNVGDVDVAEGLLHVRGSLARGAAGEVKAPKSAAALRAVPIPDSMTGLFRAHTRARQRGPLFVASDGRRLRYHSSRRALMRTAEEAGVPGLSEWHALRRTAATTALQAGLTLKDVSRLLGHATASQTLAAYVAARDSRALAPALDGLASTALGTTNPDDN